MNNSKINVSIIGGSGYAGGEILRMLLNHPNVTIKQITSQRFANKRVGLVHPNLRGSTEMKFSGIENLENVDLIFCCLPNMSSMKYIDQILKKTDRLIDTGADFRLQTLEDYKIWYNMNHIKEEMLNQFAYGLVELHRDQIKKSKYVACGGCEATCSILSLYPMFKEDLVINEEVYIDAKIGSSAAGNKSSNASHHPERSGCLRSYKLTGHRHIAEIQQETGANQVHLSATALDMVRGILITAQLKLKSDLTERDIRKLYKSYYAKEPFIRIIKERQGLYRYPEPKILAGTNFCDIGFEKDDNSNRLVVVGAIDNLGKGTAGQAVQAMNVMYGFDERLGLEFTGLHPI